MCRGNMASSAKRRAIGVGQHPAEEDSESPEEASEDDGDSGEEDSHDSEEEINEEVLVDFEAHTISDNDFNGIRKLLQQLFLKANVDVSELTDIIIQQNHIGSVIRQGQVDDSDDDEEDDPDEVFGFLSLLNLSDRKGVACVEQLKEIVLSQCEKEDSRFSRGDAARLQTALSDADRPVGLLLSERFVNVPPQIALPLYQQLQKEIAECQRTNKPSGKCHYWLMISKTCRADKKSGSGRARAPQEELMFSNAEEEFFYEQATVSFSYSVQEEADSCLGGRWSFDDVPMRPMRTVMLVPVDRMGVIMDKLKDYLSV